MKKKIFFLIIIFFLSFNLVQAFNENEVFKAKVVEILEQRNNLLPDGQEVEQQDLRLVGLNGIMDNEEFVFKGIGNFDVIKKDLYKVGDKVLVIVDYSDIGEVNYYITDYIRTNSLIFLFIAFCFSIIIIGGFKGFRSLLSLVVSFFLIINYIIPAILNGSNPIFIAISGSFIILLTLIYLTEGVNKTSHFAVLSVFISLIFIVILSWLSVGFAKLSGLSGDDVFYLVNIGDNIINFKGLLLAGIILGSAGILDDVVVSQVATARQIKESNPNQSKKEIFRRTYKVGISHISSMTNTLFLAYAGVSLPLLILFVSGESAFSGWDEIINNEIIATEIVRTLSGSIGLILSVPITTFIVTFFLKDKK
jgi:uncharacterized membrane protein